MHALQFQQRQEMGTGWSQEGEDSSQPQTLNQSTNTIHDHNSQNPVQNHREDTKFNRTNSKEDQKKKLADEHSEASQGNGKSKARVASSSAVEVKQLPHNWEAILMEADSPIDRSSVDRIYEQLHQGVFLNQKRKKYWVEKRTNSNCFMLFARDLLITWADNSRFWQYQPCVSKYSSEETVNVAELLNVCWLEVHARFDTAKLSPGTQYEVVFVVMLKDPGYGWEAPVIFRFTLPNGAKQEHMENLMVRPRAQWLEIPVGEYMAFQDNKGGEMEISMYEYEGGKWKKGLVVKGIIIRPKI